MPTHTARPPRTSLSRRRITAPSLAVAAVAVALTAGCGSSVSGSASPDAAPTGEAASSAAPTSAPTTSGQSTPSSRDLTALLLDPASFPPRYDAIVLPPQAIAQASPDLTGIPAGAEVDPAGCKPPGQDLSPSGTALVVGTDNDDRSTISIELTAVSSPLSDRRDQLEECAEVRATKAGATSVVRSTLSPAPPIDADDTLAVKQTVSSGAGGDAVTQSMLTLMAQVDDVRIAATHMSFDDGTPDAAALDELFTAAVQKVRAG